MENTQTTCKNATSRQKQTRVTEQARRSSGAVIGRRSTAGREAELVRTALQKEPAPRGTNVCHVCCNITYLKDRPNVSDLKAAVPCFDALIFTMAKLS